MHDVIRTRGPEDPGLHAAAARQGDGWIYIIDLRTPGGPRGKVPPEDIIGGFKVAEGELLSSTYWANHKHIVLTTNGLVQLPPPLRAAFVAELQHRANTPFPPDSAAGSSLE
jgi:hypothetical protein